MIGRFLCRIGLHWHKFDRAEPFNGNPAITVYHSRCTRCGHEGCDIGVI